MALDITSERFGGVVVLALAGRLDNDGADEFELAAQEALAGGARHLLVDLASLGYLSNAGLRALAATAKALEASAGTLRLCGPSASLRQVFEASGFGAVFEIDSDRSAALARHPAARERTTLAGEASRLLGVALRERVEGEAADADEAAHKRLAELVLELLVAHEAPRAARALAGGTRVQARAVPVASAQDASARPAARPWWRRLFGGSR